MVDVKIDAGSPCNGHDEDAALKARRPWRAPVIINATVRSETNHKASDYLPEGKLGSTTIIS
jgi:hypothetical protein